jgi:hypothetical protein
VKAKLAEADGHRASAEQMVGFLKDQISEAGKAAGGAGAAGSAGAAGADEEAWERLNGVLEAMLIQIPTGSVGDWDAEDAVAKATGRNEGARGAMTKVEMVWAEVRELVSSWTGPEAPSGPGEQGISSQLAIARLRGKVDHLTQAPARLLAAPCCPTPPLVRR